MTVTLEPVEISPQPGSGVKLAGKDTEDGFLVGVAPVSVDGALISADNPLAAEVVA